jgi:hypothetical protein
MSQLFIIQCLTENKFANPDMEHYIWGVEWDRALLHNPEWPPKHRPPASAFQVLGLQVCTSMPG